MGDLWFQGGGFFRRASTSSNDTRTTTGEGTTYGDLTDGCYPKEKRDDDTTQCIQILKNRARFDKGAFVITKKFQVLDMLAGSALNSQSLQTSFF